MSKDAQNVGKAAEEFGEALGQIFPTRTGSIQVSCNGVFSDKCCGYKKSTSTRGDDYVASKVKVHISSVDCGSSKTQYFYEFEGQAQGKKSDLGTAIDLFKKGAGPYTFTLNCGEPGKAKKAGSTEVYYCKGSPDKGCTDEKGNEDWQCGDEWAGASGPSPGSGDGDGDGDADTELEGNLERIGELLKKL